MNCVYTTIKTNICDPEHFWTFQSVKRSQSCTKCSDSNQVLGINRFITENLKNTRLHLILRAICGQRVDIKRNQ